MLCCCFLVFISKFTVYLTLLLTLSVLLLAGRSCCSSYIHKPRREFLIAETCPHHPSASVSFSIFRPQKKNYCHCRCSTESFWQVFFISAALEAAQICCFLCSLGQQATKPSLFSLRFSHCSKQRLFSIRSLFCFLLLLFYVYVCFRTFSKISLKISNVYCS